MRWVLLVALALGACGDNKLPAARDDAGVTPDAADVPSDGPAARGPCLDHPTDVPTPGAQLPCDLLPPGVVLP